jgi:signal transduction histidine kinase
VALAVAIAFFAAVEGQVMFNVRAASTSTVATEKSIIANCAVAAIAITTEAITIQEYQMADTRLGFLHQQPQELAIASFACPSSSCA